MLKLLPLAVATAAIAIGASVSSVPVLVEDGGADMCYACCSNNEIWLPCCRDENFEYHAFPCFAWGSGVVGSCHDNCVWGGCAQHMPCGGEEDLLLDVAGRIAAGDIALVTEIRQGAYPSLVLNEQRNAVQAYSRCDKPFPQLVGHLPLDKRYMVSMVRGE